MSVRVRRQQQRQQQQQQQQHHRQQQHYHRELSHCLSHLVGVTTFLNRPIQRMSAASQYNQPGSPAARANYRGKPSPAGAYRYKKSKAIKINAPGFGGGGHYKRPETASSSSSAAAAHLANILHSELTINLTKNEPRVVIYNQQQELNPFAKKSLPFQHRPPANSLGAIGGVVGALGARHGFPQPPPQHRYCNRFKYVKPGTVKYNAPYNTTQYIMYDYSKRTPHDQVCPNEQKQFSDDWNMALANAGSTSSNNAFSLSSLVTEEDGGGGVGGDAAAPTRRRHRPLSVSEISVNEKRPPPTHIATVQEHTTFSSSL